MDRLISRSVILKSLFALAVVTSFCLAVPHGALADWRSIDGVGNNETNPTWGAAGAALTRKVAAQYPGDGSGTTILEPPSRPNARDVSNAVVVHGSDNLLNTQSLSSGVWQWGQFLDHDIDLSGAAASNGTADIPLSVDDPLGPNPIPFERSNYADGTGIPGMPRQQKNEITSFIDASNVYGSDSDRAAALRAPTGGKLKTSAGNLLPLNTPGLPNAGGTSADLFLAGDFRANEQVALTAMHTLFVREHNRLVDLLSAQNAALGDDDLYYTARAVVGAELQAITYHEFLPMLLGPAAPKAEDYSYSSEVNPTIRNDFASGMYRFGHSMLTSELMMVDENGDSAGSLPLREAFFNPDYLKDDPTRVDKLLMGLAMQRAEEIDIYMVDDVRDFLFGPPGAGGMDLAALNIQRGRDHGLADFNTMKIAYGQTPFADFGALVDDTQLQAELETLYGDISNLDTWVGALLEHHAPGACVGPLIQAALVEQFTLLRDGDRFFHLADPMLQSDDVLAVIDLDSLTLSQVIEWNTVMADMRPSYFVIPEPSSVALLLLGASAFFLLREKVR